MKQQLPLTNNYSTPKNRKMFAVPYVVIFAFHPDLHIVHKIIEHSFGHFLIRLADLTYLKREQLKFKEEKTLLQLKDCALAVHARNSDNAISEMFTTELKLLVDCLLKWFNAKFKLNNLELSNSMKRKYENENTINWSSDRCCICTFPFKINATKFNVDNETMSYVDFEKYIFE